MIAHANAIIYYWGGVYVNPCRTGCKSVLNVANTDPSSRAIAQYVLPYTGRAADVLGPTPQNSIDCGFPLYLSFSKRDRKVIYSDLCDWLNIGNVNKNAWHVVGNLNFSGIVSAAYTESDK